MVPVLMAVLLSTACDVFIEKNYVDFLKQKEKGVYLMKKDVEADGKFLKKGAAVRLLVVTSKDWIKVYAYPEKIDPLKAERLLVLYLFADDFEKKKFTPDFFTARLQTVLAEK